MSKKYTLDEIKEQTNISRATLYRHLDKYEVMNVVKTRFSV